MRLASATLVSCVGRSLITGRRRSAVLSPAVALLVFQSEPAQKCGTARSDPLAGRGKAGSHAPEAVACHQRRLLVAERSATPEWDALRPGRQAAAKGSANAVLRKRPWYWRRLPGPHRASPQRRSDRRAPQRRHRAGRTGSPRRHRHGGRRRRGLAGDGHPEDRVGQLVPDQVAQLRCMGKARAGPAAGNSLSGFC